jgi:hypothetical protein
LMFTERVELWVSFRNRTLNLILYPFLKSACMFESLKQSLNIFAFFKFDKNRKKRFLLLNVVNLWIVTYRIVQTISAKFWFRWRTN